MDFQQPTEIQEEARRYNKKFAHYRSAREKWALRAQEYEALVHNDVEGTGTQLKAAQLQELKNKYGIPLSVNILLAIIETVQAFLTGSSPTISVIPVGKSSKQVAYTYREILRAVQYINKFPEKIEQVVKDMITVGHGFLLVEPNNYYISNEFNCVISSIPWSYVFIDPASIKRDYEDAEMIFIAVPVPKWKAKKVYGLTDEQLAYADSILQGDTTGVSGALSGVVTEPGEAVIWVHEVYEKVQRQIWILQDGTRTFNKPEDTDLVVGQNGELKQQSPVFDTYEGTFVLKTLKIGSLIFHSEVLPVTKYPIRAYVYTHNRNPFTYGVVHGIADVQHALNKCIAITIENAQKSSNITTLAPDGSITDITAYTKARSMPGGIAFYTPDPMLPTGGAPVTVPAQPLSSAWFTLFEKLIKLMEYITGIFDIIQGSAENAPNTVGATQSIQSFGTQRPKMFARHIDWSNQDLMDVIIEYTQAYSPRENILRYISGTEVMTEIVTDIKVSMQQNENGEQQITPDENGQMASLIYNEAENRIQAILGSIKDGQYRVRYSSGANLPTTRNMALQIMQQAVGTMADETTKIVMTQAMLELMDYPEADKLLRDVNIVDRMRKTVEQLNTKIDEDSKLLQKRDKEIDNLTRALKDMEIELQLNKAKVETQFLLKDFKHRADETIKAEEEKEKEEETVSSYA